MTTSRDTLAMGIKAFWDNVGVNMRQPQWVWDKMVVDVLAPNAAVMTATYHIPHLTPQNQPHVIAGAWTAAFEKRGSRWYVIQEHLSDVARVPDSTAQPGIQPGATMRDDVPQDRAAAYAETRNEEPSLARVHGVAVNRVAPAAPASRIRRR